MELWLQWWKVVWQLRSICSRLRTFFWFSTCLAGMTVIVDLLGVTSVVRSLGLKKTCYDRILDFFHSKALNLEKLIRTWVALVLKTYPLLLRINGKLVLVGDGLKIPTVGILTQEEMIQWSPSENRNLIHLERSKNSWPSSSMIIQTSKTIIRRTSQTKNTG